MSLGKPHFFFFPLCKMRVEAVLTVVVVLVAILYGLFPEDCNYVARVLVGAVLTELNAPSGPVKSNNGETVLMRTAATGHVAMAIMLLDDGHDPNRQDQVIFTRPRSFFHALTS
jgi:ankyrin repeat protein